MKIRIVAKYCTVELQKENNGKEETRINGTKNRINRIQLGTTVISLACLQFVVLGGLALDEFLERGEVSSAGVLFARAEDDLGREVLKSGVASNSSSLAQRLAFIRSTVNVKDLSRR